MIANPRISVIIPLYNKENTILDTVHSVLNQTFTDFELLIIDDGSTDKSVEVVQKIQDKRIRIISKRNGGVSSARNFGIAKSSADYIFFLDADDSINSNCLLEFNRLTVKYDQEFVFVCNFKIVQQNRNELIISSGIREELFKNPLKQQWHRVIYPRTGSMLIHKDCFKTIGGFRNEINIFEDLEFTNRLLKQFNVVYTPLILMSYQVEYIAQSKKIQNLSNEFAYYIDLRSDDCFERLIQSQNLYCAYMKRKKLGDIESAKYLFNKHKKDIFLILFSMVYKKFLDWNIMFFKSIS